MRVRSRFMPVVLFLALVCVAAVHVGAKGRQTPPPTPPAPAPAPAPQVAAPARPAPTPMQQQLADIQKEEDPQKKLDALKKYRTDAVAAQRQVDDAIFAHLVSKFPDRTAELSDALDKQITNQSTLPADFRPVMINSVVARMITSKAIVDKQEKILLDALSSIDAKAFGETWRKQARDAKPPRPEPKDSEIASRIGTMKAPLLETLGRYYVAKKDDAKAYQMFCDALAESPSQTTAAVPLAEIEIKQGNDRAALDHYLLAAVSGRLKNKEDAAFRALYAKLNGSDAGIDDALDRTYTTKFPNPVGDITKYTKAPARSNRMVIAEMFTGSGCPPCVAADLALDKVMDRYTRDDVAVLTYHVHIPQPDPMTTPGSVARKDYYAVQGVPTFHVDGPGQPTLTPTPGSTRPMPTTGKGYFKIGGGGRDNAGTVYADYIKGIDKELERPAEAALALQAAIAGDKVTVTTKVSKVADGAKDLKLHVVLGEQELRFTGENGMRFHPLVVRGVAGDENPGLPVTLDAKRGATVQATFDLATIRTQITKSLADEIEKRRKTEASGANAATVEPREYRAENHPYTAIDTNALTVVVFLQDGTKDILQAARFDIPAKGKKK